jgi:hypothetical protein
VSRLVGTGERSFTGTPRSASFNTPAIGSSLNRLFFMAHRNRPVATQCFQGEHNLLQ